MHTFCRVSMGLTFCFSLSLRSTCNQVAAALSKVEHALKNGLTLANSPTSRECVWNKYGAKKKAWNPRGSVKWKKPHHSKKGKYIMKCFGSSLILSLQTSVKNKQTNKQKTD